MLNKDTIIKVTNRSYGSVGYEVPDLGIRREYQPKEIKEVTYEELLKLSYSSGGKRIIEKYLVVDNEEAVAQLLGDVEPEYYYTEIEVKELLLNGSYAQLEDCLDFAGSGVIDLVRKLAVDLQINDIRKREIILEKTGFNVSSAIQIAKDAQEENDVQPSRARRRSAPISVKDENRKSSRQVSPQKYKVTSIQE